MADPRGALEDEEEDGEDEVGEDWEDLPERESTFDMLRNMIPASHGGSRATRSSDRTGRRGRGGRHQGGADSAANVRPARNMR